MNTKTSSLILVVASSLLGCGLKTYSSGVLPMGPDTYSVSADDLNPSTAKQASLTQAQSHCATLGKEILVTNTRDSRRDARTMYDVTFRCLSKGDPELARPTYETPPDVRIEDRRR